MSSLPSTTISFTNTYTVGGTEANALITWRPGLFANRSSMLKTFDNFIGGSFIAQGTFQAGELTADELGDPEAGVTELHFLPEKIPDVPIVGYRYVSGAI